LAAHTGGTFLASLDRGAEERLAAYVGGTFLAGRGDAPKARTAATGGSLASPTQRS